MTSQVTAIVPAYRRKAELWLTLRKLQECDPLPAEIIVHLDHGASIAAGEIHTFFPDVQVLASDRRMGPGGARNKMIAAASTEWVASFDDDSYPENRDYFAVLEKLAKRYPEVSIIAATAHIRGSDPQAPSQHAEWVAGFLGCACAYRRADFLESAGYVPVPLAYGMEEVDLALRYHAAGKKILRTEALRVFHDTGLSHVSRSAIVGCGIANAALHAFLRYPVAGTPLALLQWANQILAQVWRGRFRGALLGILWTPVHLTSYARYRAPVSMDALRSYRALVRQATPVP